MLNENLKKLRIQNNKTQKELALFLNCSVACYNRYEKGEREPNLDMIVKICKFYKISADYLLSIDFEE